MARGLAGAALVAVPVTVAAAIGFGTSLSGLTGGLSELANGPDDSSAAGPSAPVGRSLDRTLLALAGTPSAGTGDGGGNGGGNGGNDNDGGSVVDSPGGGGGGGEGTTGTGSGLPDLGLPGGGPGGGGVGGAPDGGVGDIVDGLGIGGLPGVNP